MEEKHRKFDKDFSEGAVRLAIWPRQPRVRAGRLVTHSVYRQPCVTGVPGDEPDTNLYRTFR
jgi:hypothetical protein